MASNSWWLATKYSKTLGRSQKIFKPISTLPRRRSSRSTKASWFCLQDAAQLLLVAGDGAEDHRQDGPLARPGRGARGDGRPGWPAAGGSVPAAIRLTTAARRPSTSVSTAAPRQRRPGTAAASADRNPVEIQPRSDWGPTSLTRASSSCKFRSTAAARIRGAISWTAATVSGGRRDSETAFTCPSSLCRPNRLPQMKHRTCP